MSAATPPNPAIVGGISYPPSVDLPMLARRICGVDRLRTLGSCSAAQNGPTWPMIWLQGHDLDAFLQDAFTLPQCHGAGVSKPGSMVPVDVTSQCWHIVILAQDGLILHVGPVWQSKRTVIPWGSVSNRSVVRQTDVPEARRDNIMIAAHLHGVRPSSRPERMQWQSIGSFR
ncbi:hypothetical protein VTI74DRAFT_5322 [Chaetomium olivicolor]